MANRTNPSPVIAEPFKKPLSAFTYDNRFAYGFCSCCEDCGLCCLGMWCLPCLTWCTYIDAKEGGCAGCWQCFTFPLPLGMLKCSNIGTLRTKLRANYKIHGSILEDSLYTTFCPCCAVIQLKQELKVHGECD